MGRGSVSRGAYDTAKLKMTGNVEIRLGGVRDGIRIICSIASFAQSVKANIVR